MLTKIRALGLSPAVLAGAAVFFSSPLAFLLTRMAPNASWHAAYAVRVGWQLGGALLFAGAIVGTTPARRRTRRIWLTAFSWLVLGWLFAENPALDLAEGPACEQKETARVTILRHTGRVLSGECR